MRRTLLDATFEGQIPAGSTVEHDLGEVPVGKRWRVLKLGASQFASGSNVSGRVRLELKVGGGAWRLIREIALTSTTHELAVDVDVEGPVDAQADAAEVRLVRENGPGQPREITTWITGYEF